MSNIYEINLSGLSKVEQQLNGKLPELINVPQKPHPS